MDEKSSSIERPKLVIYGAGSVGGQFAADYWSFGKHREEFDLIGLIDDDNSKKGEIIYGSRVLGSSKIFPDLLSAGIDHVVMTLLLDPVERLKRYEALDAMGFKCPSIINVPLPEETKNKIGKGVYVDELVKFIGYDFEMIGDFSFLGPGIKIGADVQINGNELTIDETIIKQNMFVERGVKIGRGVIISPGVFIGYGSTIGDMSVMYPGSRCLNNTIIGQRCKINVNAIAHRVVPDDKIVHTYDYIRTRFIEDK